MLQHVFRTFAEVLRALLLSRGVLPLSKAESLVLKVPEISERLKRFRGGFVGAVRLFPELFVIKDGKVKMLWQGWASGGNDEAVESIDDRESLPSEPFQPDLSARRYPIDLPVIDTIGRIRTIPTEPREMHRNVDDARILRREMPLTEPVSDSVSEYASEYVSSHAASAPTTGHSPRSAATTAGLSMPRTPDPWMALARARYEDRGDYPTDFEVHRLSKVFQERYNYDLGTALRDLE